MRCRICDIIIRSPRWDMKRRVFKDCEVCDPPDVPVRILPAYEGYNRSKYVGVIPDDTHIADIITVERGRGRVNDKPSVDEDSTSGSE